MKRTPIPGSKFQRFRTAEEGYARNLRKIARHIGDYVNGVWSPGDLSSAALITDAMSRYARSLIPWAEAVGERMVKEVAARDRAAWRKTAAEMGRLLGQEIDRAPTGLVMRQRMADQVSLITSLPTEAAERVHTLTLEGITEGRRASEVAAEILRTSKMTAARANTIARTEVSRTSTELTRARAEHVGSPGYIWKTANDGDRVRPSHRKMRGAFVRWDAPPTLDGMVGHAGCLPNCRCFASPIIPN
jgi:SPP1 gp7 family putative phage head morphogenesis protein